jgi:hypothetical protein
MRKLIGFMAWAGFALPVLGQPDAALPNFWHTDGNVDAVQIENGVAYLGGTFHFVGPQQELGALPDADTGVARYCLGAIELSTGEATAFNAHVGGNPPSAIAANVRAVAVDGLTVYLGGEFNAVGNGVRSNLAAVNAATGALLPWNPAPDGTGITALAVAGDTVFVGGQFETIGGAARSNLAALDVISGAARTWAPNPNGIVYAIVIVGDTLYVGGEFTQVGGVERRYLAAVNSEGTVLD